MFLKQVNLKITYDKKRKQDNEQENEITDKNIMTLVKNNKEHDKVYTEIRNIKLNITQKQDKKLTKK